MNESEKILELEAMIIVLAKKIEELRRKKNRWLYNAK